MKTLLAHVCCGPCFIAPYHVWVRDYAVTAFWYNPNIHPYTEYTYRLHTVQEMVACKQIAYLERDEYGLIEFTRKSVYKEDQRCVHCYSDRLEAVALLAHKLKFDFFTTSLLFSRRQKHEVIKEIASDLAQRYQIAFLYQDLRELWQEGITLSKDLGMYRQKYCGCIYSEAERYHKQRNSK